MHHVTADAYLRGLRHQDNSLGTLRIIQECFVVNLIRSTVREMGSRRSHTFYVTSYRR